MTFFTLNIVTNQEMALQESVKLLNNHIQDLKKEFRLDYDFFVISSFIGPNVTSISNYHSIHKYILSLCLLINLDIYCWKLER